MLVQCPRWAGLMQRPYPRTSHRASGASRASGPGTGLEPRALSSMPGKARLSEMLPSGVRVAVGVGALFVDSAQVCVGKSSASSSSSSTVMGGVANQEFALNNTVHVLQKVRLRRITWTSAS